MREIFTELYKKVLGFFQTQEKENIGGSNKVATNRLKLVLMQDRTNLTPFLLERMRGEMIDVLSKYVEMDKEALELNFEQEGEQMALMLSIPVLRAKEEEEIQAIIKAEEEEAKAKATEEEIEAETENSDEKGSNEPMEEQASESEENSETEQIANETEISSEENVEEANSSELEDNEVENAEDDEIVSGKKSKKKK